MPKKKEITQNTTETVCATTRICRGLRISKSLKTYRTSKGIANVINLVLDLLKRTWKNCQIE